MALKLTIEAPVHANAKLQWDVIGVWTLRQAGSHLGVSGDEVGGRTRKGEFRARQQLTPWGYDWNLELLEEVYPGEAHDRMGGDGPRAELRHMEIPPDGRSHTQPKSDNYQALNGWTHRELMDVLKEELAAWYGQVQELRVFFQQVQSQVLSLPWQLQKREPWWRRLRGA